MSGPESSGEMEGCVYGHLVEGVVGHAGQGGGQPCKALVLTAAGHTQAPREGQQTRSVPHAPSLRPCLACGSATSSSGVHLMSTAGSTVQSERNDGCLGNNQFQQLSAGVQSHKSAEIAVYYTASATSQLHFIKGRQMDTQGRRKKGSSIR